MNVTARISNHTDLQDPALGIIATPVVPDEWDTPGRPMTFRATRMAETVEWDDRLAEWVHRVLLRGPVQTAKGNDHATREGKREFSTSPAWRTSSMADLPGSLTEWLVGVDVLRDALRDRLA